MVHDFFFVKNGVKMDTFRNVLLATHISLLTLSSFGSHFVKVLKPVSVKTMGENEELFMAKFSGRNYENKTRTKLLMARSDGRFEIFDKESPKSPFMCQAYKRVGVKYVNF